MNPKDKSVDVFEKSFLFKLAEPQGPKVWWLEVMLALWYILLRPIYLPGTYYNGTWTLSPG